MLNKNRIWPLAAFVFICLVGYGARIAIGDVYSAAEARQLLEALSRAGLYLGSAIATASATVLALMLTLIGMINRMEKEFDREAFHNVDLVAKLATSALMMSLVVLLAFVLPIGEFEELPNRWYTILYDVLFAGSVLMVALIAATVVMIYRTLQRVMSKITPGEDV
ncbi:hypothetical protein NAP1_02310 [Erythrobacter sp. NAP1]|uniref:hypothetical protein n=1 Tax=Erythrobacter sp. NAP1 TaxID=237727 RepID=UPI0000686E28|nr:hypothetical protein [Erythrobacter sp. NAP1]EAQ29568.1 hypothetical protein NAP1_02310 [Erythrobacter sp. NAP1]